VKMRTLFIIISIIMIIIVQGCRKVIGGVITIIVSVGESLSTVCGAIISPWISMMNLTRVCWVKVFQFWNTCMALKGVSGTLFSIWKRQVLEVQV
jgi:hypothetical protein